MSRSWTIGALPDCDLVVDLPKVSGRHCRLTLADGVYSLEDLGSTNGTYVKGARISERVRVEAGEEITLGRTALMPWPSVVEPPPVRILRVGREPDNDFVIPLPMVSGHHARVLWEGKPGEAIVEDLGSANGVAVGSPEGKAVRSTFRSGDTLYFGTHAVPASDLLARLESPLVPPVAGPSDESKDDESTDEKGSVADPTAHSSGPIGLPGRPVRMLALLLQAPLMAVAIGAISGSDVRSTPEAAGGFASVLSCLAFAAVWFGLSDAVIGGVSFRETQRRGGPTDLASMARRVGPMVVLAALQCSIAWTIASGVAGLGADWLASVALLFLASAVGLALGGLIVALSPRPVVGYAALAAVMIPLWLFGGGPRSLTRVAPIARLVSNVVPSRWAFEGLLLLESDRRPGREAGRDLAEAYFPADSERMGPRADAMALGLTLLGLSAASAFITWASRSGRAAPSTP